jgi:hypothetical protein
MAGLPFLVDGIVGRWPLNGRIARHLRQRYGAVPVRARVGDYIGTAFAPDRAMQDMTMLEYLELAERTAGLPPYLGNLELKELNRLCHWPAYFDKMGPPLLDRPGRHHDAAALRLRRQHFRADLGPQADLPVAAASRALPVCAGSQRHAVWLAFNPEAPDFGLTAGAPGQHDRGAVQPGDMLYVPAGWYHQVHALTFSLSNRWARGVPLVLAASASTQAERLAHQSLMKCSR